MPLRGYKAPVDVSAWTMNNITGLCSNIAFSTSSSENTSPQGFFMITVSALCRSHISLNLNPKYPFAQTKTLSPSATKFVTHVSIAALPVPDIGIVNSLFVYHTYLKRSLTSSQIAINYLSICPIKSKDIISKTLLSTLEGPGPSNKRVSDYTLLYIGAFTNNSDYYSIMI